MKVVRLLEPLPVVGRRGVVGHALAARAAHPARHQAALRNHVDYRKLLHQPQGVVPDGQNVAEQHYLGALGHAGENARLDVHGAAHAERRAVMLVEHQAVEAHLLGVQPLVDVAVVEVGPNLGVVDVVAEVEVLDWQARRPEVARFRVLVGSLREVTYEHAGFLLPACACRRPLPPVNWTACLTCARTRPSRIGHILQTAL